jgi:YggT family protein
VRAEYGAMGVIASLALLGTAESSIQQFVWVFFNVYVLLVLAYIILSFVPPGSLGPIEPARGFLYEVVDPYLRLFRRFVPPLGPVDLSPMVGIFILLFGERLVHEVIGRIL